MTTARRPYPPRRRPALLVPSILALFALSCFEQPISERMEIRFLPQDAVMVRVTVRLMKAKDLEKNPPARDRVEEMQRAIAEGRDAWSARIDAMLPENERITLDREAGQIVRMDQRAIVLDLDRLPSFFRDTPIQATVRRREGETEFLLVPLSASRAGRQEQETLAREMETWAATAARYLEAGRRLYEHLDDNPDRAASCFAVIFRDILPDDDRDAHGALEPGDEAIVTPFKQAMHDFLDLFSVSDGAYSLEELSRLVHDPFPAPLAVRVPGPILESEGFEAGDQGVLTVPPVSLWGAFTRLHHRWIDPDPAVIYYEHLSNGKAKLDLGDFLRRPRSASPPASAFALHDALRDELHVEPAYRVRWSTVDLPEIEEKGEVWDLSILQ